MNYLSVCSGVEAATVAWHQLGWNPLAFSEIEKFPSEVLKHHYPSVQNLGDMTKYKEWDFGTNRLDLLVGGTPCQSFSVAGLRKGLEDPRGNLALVYCGILDKFRPKWFVWENVPGVLSSGGGRDFGSFLGALAELGYGFSYRVLDAQNFGVAQRRRRVFVVGHLGDWRPAAEVLFESESLRGDIKSSRKKVEEATTFVESSFGTFRQETNAPLTQTIALAENTIGRQPQNGGNGDGFTECGPMYTLNATGVHGVSHNMSVRRLTEVECERLQGFPDNYTNIKENCPSGPRYKAMGNSMAVPVMRWIGERIQQLNNGERYVTK
jgi:DNA (cytosine-5)-methyltransferase 1